MKRLLLVPPSPQFPGSRGDQAVLLTTRDQLVLRKFEVSIVVTDPADEEWQFLKDESVHLVRLSQAKLESYDRVTIMGTDVFDGAYSRKDFEFMEKVSRKFVAQGKYAEILGVSIRPEVHPVLKKRAASLAGIARITVRDPTSFARFMEFRPLRPPVLVADPAFLLNPAEPPDDVRSWVENQKSQGRVCIGINLNRHLDGDADHLATGLARTLSELPNAAVVLIPHDSRPIAGDLEMCGKLRDALLAAGNRNVILLPMLSARLIKGLCAYLDCVVTGRMHLAIASLGQGIPVVGIDYNFKMKGLFGYFGLQDHVIQPEKLPQALQRLVVERTEIREKIQSNLIRVRWLSARNFDAAYVEPGHGACDSARFVAWSAAEHRPKWPEPIGADQRVTRSNLRALLTIDYHRIEKGLALPNPRKDFGQASGLVLRLLRNLEIYLDRHGVDMVAATVLTALQAYADFSGWEPLLEKLPELNRRMKSTGGEAGVATTSRDEQLRLGRRDLADFFKSRASVRSFSDKPVEIAEVMRAVQMAHEGTPSVCNRQPYRVRVLCGESMAAALSLQNGNSGFGDTVDKLLLVTADTQWFETAAERNQPWIAGGLFCMSLMYALHSLGLATCPLNWDVPPLKDAELRERVAVQDSEVVIMMIAVGHYPDTFPIAKSRRLPLQDIAKVVD